MTVTDEQQRQLAQWKQRAEDRIGELDNALAAMTRRAEQAEREAMVCRVLLTGAMIQAGFENKATDYGKFSVEYFTGLFGVALNSGGFFDEGCEWPEIQRVAELLHVDLSDYEEAQP
jgi:hypothetical protein